MTAEPEAPEKPARTVVRRKKSGEVVIIKPPAGGRKTEKPPHADGLDLDAKRGEYGLTTSRYFERAEGKTCPVLRLTEEGVALITSMYAYGSTQAEVAAILGVSPDVLQNSANREIDRHARELGAARWAQEIRVQQRTILRGGDTKMAIWLGKQVLGQQDRMDITATVSDVSSAEALSYDEAMDLLERVAGKRLRAEAKMAAKKTAKPKKAPAKA